MDDVQTTPAYDTPACPFWSRIMNAPLLAPGGRIDESWTITPVRVAVLTVSDTRDEESDTSGHILAERVTGAGHQLAGKALVPDDRAAIRAQVMAWVASGAVDAIVTTGGTGLTGRDVTPEALEPLFDKRIDGFSVVFHLVSYQTVGLSTLQSRATAGLIGGVFVFCLPGSNGAVKDGWDKVIAAQLDSRHRPCNMVELMPRLAEV
jgi:molybdenum cofactor biosynthesis protein B